MHYYPTTQYLPGLVAPPNPILTHIPRLKKWPLHYLHQHLPLDQERPQQARLSKARGQGQGPNFRVLIYRPAKYHHLGTAFIHLTKIFDWEETKNRPMNHVMLKAILGFLNILFVIRIYKWDRLLVHSRSRANNSHL